MLKVVGRLLQESSWLVKGLTFDAHESHCFFREALMGHFERLDPDLLQDIPWFKDLSYKDLPLHALPRLPIRFCLDHDEVIWPVQGPCHLEILDWHFWSFLDIFGICWNIVLIFFWTPYVLASIVFPCFSHLFTMGHVSSCSLGHATKNCAGQLVSPVRNLHFGSYFVDSTGCRSLGLPPSAYVRSEPMSDSLHCTLWNPYYCVTTPVPGFGLMHYDALFF